MVITITWGTRVINIPKADTQLIEAGPPQEIRQLDLDVFRLRLKDLEDDEEGMPFPDTHRHNPSVTVGGAILAKVIEIINGYTVTFEDGQYAVNLVGANSNVGDVVNVNQVSIRSANSAGLQDLDSLQAASFQGAVTIDIEANNTGTIFPVGTREYPVNNLADALAIAQNRGLVHVSILSDMTIDSGDWSAGYHFMGGSPVVLVLTLGGANLANCHFLDLTVQGTLNSDMTFTRCHIRDVGPFDGQMYECSIEGTVTLGGAADHAIFANCYSEVAGGGPSAFPIIDMGGSGNDLVVRGWNGGLGIINCNGPADISFDFVSGRLIFDATVTAGDFTVRGVCAVVDDSGTGATISDLTVTRVLTLLEKYSRNKTITDPVTGTITVYDDDGTTVLYVGNIYEDAAGLIPYKSTSTQIERKERLV